MPSPRHTTYAVLFAAFALSCAESNFEPVAPRALDPPDIYRTWWNEVETCIGTSAPFERIHWYEAKELVNRDEGTGHVGAWLPPHTIYIRSDRLLFTVAVKHEMVHELLQRRDHETLFFKACAGL